VQRIIDDHRPLVEDLTSAGLELSDMYALDEGQSVRNDVTQVTSRYDEVKHAIRDRIHQLNDSLRSTATEVSYLSTAHNL